MIFTNCVDPQQWLCPVQEMGLFRWRVQRAIPGVCISAQVWGWLGSIMYRVRGFSRCPDLSFLLLQFMRWWQWQEMSGEQEPTPTSLLLSLESLGLLPRLISQASEYLEGNLYLRGLFFSNFYCILMKRNIVLMDVEGINLKGISRSRGKSEFLPLHISYQIPCKPAFLSVGGNVCSDPRYIRLTLARCGDTCFS